jgi:DNA-directed RNA polymerase specialized sigma24 family protein
MRGSAPRIRPAGFANLQVGGDFAAMKPPKPYGPSPSPDFRKAPKFTANETEESQFKRAKLRQWQKEIFSMKCFCRPTQKVDKGKIIQRCLNMLPVPHCEVIDLVYYHEKSIKEVGEISVSG